MAERAWGSVRLSIEAHRALSEIQFVQSCLTGRAPSRGDAINLAIVETATRMRAAYRLPEIKAQHNQQPGAERGEG